MSDEMNGSRKILGGEITTREIPLAADTYHVGMRLEYNGTSKLHVVLASGSLSAVYNGTDGRVLAATGTDNCIVGGEIAESGIVDASGAPLAAALTEDEKVAYQIAGFYVKQY